MSTDTLDLPPIVDPASVDPQSTAVAKIDLQAMALSRFGDWRSGAAALVAKYRDATFDLSTPAGYRALTEALAEVRRPRYAAQNVSKASKSELAKISKAIGAEEDAIAQFLEPVESRLEKLKKDHDDRVAAEKAERERKDAERRKKHTDAIAEFGGWLARAAGRTSAEIERALARAEEWSTDEFEEFVPEAEQTKTRVVGGLRALHARVLGEEQQAAENERIRKANEAEQQRLAMLGRISLEVTQCFGQSAACIESRLALLRKTQYAEDTPADVLQAHAGAITQIEQLLAMTRASEAAQVDGAAQAPRSESERQRDFVEEPGSTPAGGRCTTSARTSPEAAPPITPNAHEAGQSEGTPSAFASSEAQAAQASPSGCEDTGAHAGERAPESADDNPTLTLGKLCGRLGFVMTTAFMTETLGITGTPNERRVTLYSENQWRAIKAALIAHITSL